jgi:dTDP-4-dehydrorhamnose 3,5-epimerase-like enzyme
LLRAEISELIPGLSTVKITPHEDNNREVTRTFVSAVFLIFVAGEVKVHFTQEQATKAQKGSRGIAVLFL